MRIHGALPGEQVLFSYTRRSRRFDEGVVTEVVEASGDRRVPLCPHFGVCGGCALQHQSPEAQIAAKERALLHAFETIGGVIPEQVLAPLVSPAPWGYRRKARLGVKWVEKKGKVLVGFRERGSSFVADLGRCEVLHPKVGHKLAALSELIAGLSVRDQLPQIEVAMGDNTCVLIFRLLQPLAEADLPPIEAFAAEHDFSIYVQEGGPETVRPIFGQAARLCYRLPNQGIEFEFLPVDFTQVNSDLNQRMVDRALHLMALSDEDRVIDLFCGLGNFTLPMAREARSVVGVEGDPGLVDRARGNALLNGIRNVDFFSSNLYDAVDAEPWMGGEYDKALLDPPRSGALEVLEHLPRLGVRRIVYVSCYPGTLARDAGALVNMHGYTLVAAGVMDMFPHTAHVESIALFERREDV